MKQNAPFVYVINERTKGGSYDMKYDYKEAVLKYKDMVYRIAFAQCSCRQDAEDVFQDVFFKLYNSDGDFADEEHLKAWLINTAAFLPNKGAQNCGALYFTSGQRGH